MKLPRWIVVVILGSALIAACGGGGATPTPGSPTSPAQTTPLSNAAPTMNAATSAAVPPTAGAPEPGGGLATLGKTVYGQNCAGCHGENGQGSGSFPALAGNATAAGDPAALIKFVVNGKNGSHNFGDKLSDQEIAAVLTYIRANWGNQAGEITADQVKSNR